MEAREYKEKFYNLNVSHKKELINYLSCKDLKGLHSLFSRPRLTTDNYKKFMYFLDKKLFSKVKDYVDTNDFYGEKINEKTRLENYIKTDDFKRLNYLSQNKVKFYLKTL